MSKVAHILDKQTDLLVAILDPEAMMDPQSENIGYWGGEHIDSSTNLETFDFVADGNSKSSEFLTGENRILISGDEPGTWKEFIIWHTHRENGEVEVKSNGSYIEIAKDKIVLPLVQEGLSAKDCLLYVLSESDWKVGIVEGSARKTITIGEVLDGYQYLLRVAGNFDMKLRFRVIIHGNKIVGRYVDLVYNIGNNLGKEIILGKDLIGVQRDELTDEIVTAMVVQGPEREDGTKLTIVVEDLEARQRWGRGSHMWGYHQVESENKDMGEVELRQYGTTALKKKINSVIRYTADAVSLEHIFGLSHERTLKGDRVRVKDTSYNPPLYLEARVVEIRRNPASAKAKRFVLGDFVEYSEEAIMASFRKLQAELKKKLELGEVIDLIDTSAIVKSPIAPEAPNFNALWLDTSVFPNVLYRWNGEWVKASPTVPADIGAETPDGAQGKVEIMQLRMEINNTSSTVRELGVSVQELNANEFLQSNPVLTALNDAHVTLIAASDELISTTQAAISDDLLTQSEYNLIESGRVDYRTAVDALIKALRTAETEVTRVSANQVVEFAEKKIHRGFNLPTDPEEDDLWVDSFVSPPVWRQYIGGTWINITRSNFVDMQGKIIETQIGPEAVQTPHLAADAVTAKHIAANVIDSDMISTVGLDAGVITFGTMIGITAEVGNAGMTAVGTTGDAIRFWAGAVFNNRQNAVFRVQNDGRVFASNIDISGGSIVGASASFGGTNNQFGVISVFDAMGELTAELNGEFGGFARLNVGHLDAPNKVEYADYRGKEYILYVATEPVNGYMPSDTNGGTSWSDALMTINEAIRRIPKSFDGNVQIKLAYQHVYNENVFLAGYSGTGNIRLTNDGGLSYIRGNINCKQNTVSFNMSNLRIDCTSTYAGVSISSAQANIQNCIVNGRADGTDHGITVGGNGNCEIYNTEVWNVKIGIRAAYGGHIMVNGCYGYASSIGMQAYGGGWLSGTGAAPTGGQANVQTNWGGLQTGSWNWPAPGSPPAAISYETGASFESREDSGTYRTSGGYWETSGTHSDKVTQGSYNGVSYQGSWFYGSVVQNTLQGKTIKSMRLSIYRFAVGTYSDQTIVIRPHTSATRPAGNVSTQSPYYSVSLAVGEAKTITLPSSFHAGFQNGDYEGFTITGAQYVGMSRGTTLEVTYA